MHPETFLGNYGLTYAGFNLYWWSETNKQRDMEVLIVVKKDILNRIIIDNQTDLINHTYCFYLDIQEFDPKSRKIGEKPELSIYIIRK